MLGKVKSFFNRDDCEKFYKLGKTLGQGSFATVRLAVHKGDGSKWAVKIIKKAQLDAEDMEGLQTEVDILRRLNHQHIIHLREVFDCSNNLYIVMELCTGGELFDRIVEKEYYTEDEARKAVLAVTHALKYCHENNVVHRDLKPENLLYSDATSEAVLKLADFGLAKLMGPNVMMHTACGTPGYVAPEILRGEAYSYEVDMWSLGVITYILLCGFPPFYDDNNVALFKAIKAGKFDYPSPYWDAVSEDAKDLINHLLVVDSKKRYTADDVLHHRFIGGQSQAPASNNHLPEFRAAMRKFNARRKFKAGIMMVQSINLLERKSSEFGHRHSSMKSGVRAEGSSGTLKGAEVKLLSEAALAGEESPSAVSAQHSSPPSDGEASPAAPASGHVAHGTSNAAAAPAAGSGELAEGISVKPGGEDVHPPLSSEASNPHAQPHVPEATAA